MTFYVLPVLKMATPCILFTSCSEYSAENIVKEILKVESLPEGEKLIENIVGYDWSIDTKYYTADVKLCLTRERTIGDKEFAESVQAFVVYFDTNKKETFESVKLWHAYIKEIDPEVKMLVCERCSENSAVNRLTAQTWCIDNGFELVELDPEVDSDSETEDDFKETTGIKRIVQSLHAHTWPNLDLKDNQHVVSPLMRQLMKEEHNAKKLSNENKISDGNQSTESTSEDVLSKNLQNDRLCSENSSRVDNENQSVTCDKNRTAGHDETVRDNSNKDKDEEPLQESSEGACGDTGEGTKSKKEKSEKKAKQPSKEERLDSLLPTEDMALFEALESEDPGGESFEKLFERFAQMKEKANGLPLQERKKYAEQVAIAFWKAIGGDEEEIGDLDSEG